MGRDEPHLNQNQEAGLLEMARRSMLRAGEADRITCQAQLTISSLESMKNLSELCLNMNLRSHHT